MFIYYDDQVRCKVLDIRKIDKKYFNPMCHSIMEKGFLKDCVQIKINSIGGPAWINVEKIKLKEIDTKSKIGWNLSGLDLSDYLKWGDIVDVQLIEYIIGCIPPIYPANNIVMMGEPHDTDAENNYTYLTFEILNEGTDEQYAKYLGIFPEASFANNHNVEDKIDTLNQSLEIRAAELLRRDSITRLKEYITNGIDVDFSEYILGDHGLINDIRNHISGLNDLIDDMEVVNKYIDNLKKKHEEPLYKF